MPVIEGTLERITYQNSENDFTVARLLPDGKTEKLITVVGIFPSLTPGESLKIKGEWVNNPKFGRQFKAESYESIMPRTLKGIEKYLGSGSIKGIGPATAQKLVSYFGHEVLEVIEKTPHRLCEVEGIGEKKAETISKGFEEQKDIRDVMIFLQNYDVSPSLAVKIYKRYQKDTISQIKENPYRLATEVTGIGFKTADKIALKLGMEFRSPHRIKAAVQYVLWEAAGNGHVFLPEEEINDQIRKLFADEEGEIETPLIKEQIMELINEKELFVEQEPGTQERLLYLAPFYHAEKGITRKLLSLKSYQLSMNHKAGIKHNDIGIKLTSKQQEALQKALEEGILIITGGPGTGKTTTIRTLISLFEEGDMQVTLTAPTGRAARRMTDATGREARTIHRLLEYGYSDGDLRFKRNEDNLLKTDVLIVDEVSMVDLLLMYNLLKALPSTCKLILVGDTDQLPSVGAGNVLRELIKSDVIPQITLDEIFRQARESLIIVNAHRINNGKFPLVNEKNKDFYFIQQEEPEKILNTILDLCHYRISRYLNVNPVEDIQVITPMRKTLVGVDNLNSCLQETLNPAAKNKTQINYGSELYRLGDKVMQIKNNYQKEVYNGDIGRIRDINTEEGEIGVVYPDLEDNREVKYSLNELDELVLSYAISVHKSQGSEYPVVIVPVVTQHFILLQRNLVYTGITRAKKLVVIVGTKKAMAIALKNNKVEERYTLLGKRLHNIID